MRSRQEVAVVLDLVRAGWNDCEIARETEFREALSGTGGEAGPRTSNVGGASAPSVPRLRTRFPCRPIPISLGSIGRTEKTNERCWEVYSSQAVDLPVPSARTRAEARTNDPAHPLATGTG